MQPNTKQALIEILEKLVGHWELAEGFLILVKEATDDKLADDLLDLIYDQMKKIENKEKQKRIYDQLKAIKQHNLEMEKDRQEAEHLLNSLLRTLEEE
jgi:polyribonucleotide nucleotidyltransferase